MYRMISCEHKNQSIWWQFSSRISDEWYIVYRSRAL